MGEERQGWQAGHGGGEVTAPAPDTDVPPFWLSPRPFLEPDLPPPPDDET